MLIFRNQDKNNQTPQQRMKKSSIFLMRGFTVVELLVVFVIIVLLSSLLIINWNKQTPNRSLTIAQNELVTNLKKVQSYAISSRNITTNNLPVKFYAVYFEKGQNQYSVYAIDSDYNISSALETIKLPAGINFNGFALTSTSGGLDEIPDCTYVIFSAVYGKVYFDGQACGTSIVALVQDLPKLAPRSNFNLEIDFAHSQTSSSKSVKVFGLNGKAEPYKAQKDTGGGGVDIIPGK